MGEEDKSEGGMEDSGMALMESLYSTSGKLGRDGKDVCGGVESEEADVDEKKQAVQEEEEEEVEESAGETTPMHLGRGVSLAAGNGVGAAGGGRGGGRGAEEGDDGWGLRRRQSLLSRFSTSQRQLNLLNHGGRLGGTPWGSAASTPRNFTGGPVGGQEGRRAELALLERLLESMERTDRRLAGLELLLEGKIGAATL